MSEVEEQIEVTIKETEEKEEKEIKEKSYIISTTDLGKNEIITELINGKLCGVIIDTDTTIDVSISLEQFPQISIYEKVGYNGCKYLSLKNDTRYSNDELTQDDSSHWYLNDKLRIQIQGPKNILVKCVVRWK